MDPEGNQLMSLALDYDPGYNGFGRDDGPAYNCPRVFFK